MRFSFPGDRAKKLFQFLNDIGARALRIQPGRVLEMAESSPDKFTYENKNCGEIRRPKGAGCLDSIGISSPETKEAAHSGVLFML
jgi:hypothetical protein